MNNGQSSTSNGLDPERVKEELESVELDEEEEEEEEEEISSTTAQRLFQDVMTDINVEMAELQHEIELFTPEEQAWINDQAVINLKDVQKTVAFARRKDMEHTTKYQKMLLEQKRKALKTFKKRLEQNTRYNPGRVAKSRAAETTYPSDDEIEVLHEKVVKKKKSKKK
ncbi:hypothetical protein L5515_006260 [Caenorhabditis briggsae]|uniref:Uncharacterized protein n=1 Tax=Caenorhabditis briggsae TaxID=6238 RepID=A0AAE9F171_CAEBR|nr:hypothetical protein L3Y34_006449 [Caenorhabditis briggsae]UMM32493.1 hypothetical protein L5515_006260 [Caenorhabditis briggsae]